MQSLRCKGACGLAGAQQLQQRRRAHVAAAATPPRATIAPRAAAAVSCSCGPSSCSRRPRQWCGPSMAAASRSSSGAACRRAPAPPAAAASSSGGGDGGLEQPAAAGGDDYGYMGEYKALKEQLLDNTRKAGGVIGAYLLLTAGGGPALCCMVGAAGSYAYFSLLCRDVDAVKGTDRVPIWEANKIENPTLRWAAKLAAAYRAALKPRLLVPVGMAAAVGVYNALADEPLPLLYTGCLLGGFLSYKGALLTKLLNELLPKSYIGTGETRPKLEAIEDELDQWGRPKKAARTPIDAMPEDAQEKLRAEWDKQGAGASREE